MSIFTWDKAHWKPSRTARKLEERQAKQSRRRDEDTAKRAVRTRDKTCRFPLCGCKRLGLPLEVSHQVHKGMGSKDGVSTTQGMVLLCNHRHQFGRISRHSGSLRAVYLDDALGYDGPVCWLVAIDALPLDDPWRSQYARTNDGWLTVAVETSPGHIAAPHPWQMLLLKRLAEMDL